MFNALKTLFLAAVMAMMFANTAQADFFSDIGAKLSGKNTKMEQLDVLVRHRIGQYIADGGDSEYDYTSFNRSSKNSTIAKDGYSQLYFAQYDIYLTTPTQDVRITIYTDAFEKVEIKDNEISLNPLEIRRFSVGVAVGKETYSDLDYQFNSGKEMVKKLETRHALEKEMGSL